MTSPLKWEYGARAELRVAAIAGAVLGIVTGYSLGHGWFNMVIWALIAQSLSAGRFIVIGLFVKLAFTDL
jgi:hypothetical protein